MSHPPQRPPSTHQSPSPIFILTLYALLTLILTHPLLFNLSTAVPNDIGDPLLNTWILSWDSHALLTDPLNLFNANIFYPLPHTLAYSEHLFSTALLALPIQLISAEPVTAYNVSLLLTFPLSAFGMYLLTLHWTRQRSAAFIAGLIFAFAPYRFAAIAHLQLLTFQWLPFTLLCLELGLIRGVGARGQGPVSNRPLTTNPWPLTLFLFLLMQLLTSWYLALYTLLILGLYLLAAFLTHQIRPSKLIPLSLLFLISIFLILPFAWPYLTLLDDLRAARPLSLALSLAAAPTDFAAAAPFNRLFGPLTEPLRARPGFIEENTLFVGIVAPLLVLASILLLFSTHRLTSSVHPSTPSAPHSTLHAPRFTLYFLLSLLILSFFLTFPTPYAGLAQLLPLTTIIRVPSRWIIPALFALSALAAFGYVIIRHYISRPTHHALRPTFHNLLFLTIIIILLAESFSVPLPLAPIENHAALSPAYHWLAEKPGDIALIELPLHSAPAPEYPEVKRLYASTLGWWKLVNGYSGYTPPRQPQLAQALTNFPNPTSIAALQNLALPPLPQPSNLPTFQPSTLFLLIHPGEAPFDRTRWETIDRWHVERNPALLPLDSFAGDYLYQILAPDPTRFTAPPLATFGQDQTIQLLAYTVSTFNVQRSTFNPPTFIPHPSSFILLYWRPTSSLPTDSTVFIHLRAADGFVRSQADGPPISGHYPTTAWQPGEVIQDIHPLPDTDLTQIDHLTIGLYDPATGERLPAFDTNGTPLSEEALRLSLR